MTPTNFANMVLRPCLGYMQSIIGTKPVVNADVELLMMAICGQESNWASRIQNNGAGPARSYGQFERNGGVAEVMSNITTSVWLKEICDSLDIPFKIDAIFEAMAWNDTLAISMIRFLIYIDKDVVPKAGLIDDAYSYYLRNWRPGAPSKLRWYVVYPLAQNALR